MMIFYSLYHTCISRTACHTWLIIWFRRSATTIFRSSNSSSCNKTSNLRKLIVKKAKTVRNTACREITTHYYWPALMSLLFHSRAWMCLYLNGKHYRTIIVNGKRKLFLTSPRLICWYYYWLHGTAIERRSLVGKLSLSCARPVADGWPFMWVNRLL